MMGWAGLAVGEKRKARSGKVKAGRSGTLPVSVLCLYPRLYLHSRRKPAHG